MRATGLGGRRGSRRSLPRRRVCGSMCAVLLPRGRCDEEFATELSVLAPAGRASGSGRVRRGTAAAVQNVGLRAYPERMQDGGRSPVRLFMPAVRQPLMGVQMSEAGLVLPGISSTAGMLGLAPVTGSNAWLDRLVRVYLDRAGLPGSFEAARGRDFDRDQWIAVLVAQVPGRGVPMPAGRAEPCRQLRRADSGLPAAVPGGHARRRGRGHPPCPGRRLDGLRRGSWPARLVLRAIRLVLVPPEPAAGRDSIRRSPTTLRTSTRRAQPCCWSTWPPTRSSRNASHGEPRFCGTTESPGHGDDREQPVQRP